MLGCDGVLPTAALPEQLIKFQPDYTLSRYGRG